MLILEPRWNLRVVIWLHHDRRPEWGSSLTRRSIESMTGVLVTWRGSVLQGEGLSWEEVNVEVR